MFKMPLIEANIATRLKYIVYLDEFLRQFKEHLIVLTKQCNKEDEEDKIMNTLTKAEQEKLIKIFLKMQKHRILNCPSLKMFLMFLKKRWKKMGC